jgi:hypothetical protein
MLQEALERRQKPQNGASQFNCNRWWQRQVRAVSKIWQSKIPVIGLVKNPEPLGFA